MELIFLIIALSLLTYLSRVFAFFFDTTNWSAFILDMIKLMPVAILATIVFTPILFPEQNLYLSWQNFALISAIVTLLIASFTKNMILTIVLGAGCSFILHSFFSS